ncbi:MAG: hypothetical protein JWN15_2122 [Firmicutes bacterium]|nr:hypothetical protein [Bacillota bacterium]
MTLYYGCDSATASWSSGTNFYVGRLGRGTSADLEFFNAAAATAVGPSQTYAYWFILGPARDPNCDWTTNTAAAWGTAQAVAFNQAWHANVQVGSKTLFGDVESGQGGWATPDRSNYIDLNYAVYKSFVTQLQSLGYKVGVYSSPNEWQTIMGSTTATAAPATVAWLASWLVDSTSPPPSAPVSFSPPSPGKFGGIDPTIWQYYGGDSADLNVATSLPI